MKVDVVICTYNRSGMLEKSIRSILDAGIPQGVSLQLIVVNNNSTDDTEAVIKGFRNVPGLKIKYLFEEKQGKSHALNTALGHITGDLIAFTDDDVTVDEGWIRSMVDALKRHPEYSCFGGKVVAGYPEDVPDWLDIDRSMQFLKSVFVDLDDGNIEVEYGKGTVSKTPSGVNMFYRRAAIDENGLFRADLGPRGTELGFSEDIEYCRRFLERGENFMYIPSAVLYHPVHKERLNRDYLLRWQYRCGRSEVRRSGGYKDVPKVLGVPRYMLKKFMLHAAGRWFSPRSKRRFYHRLRLYYTAGELVEHLRIKNGRFA